MYLGESRPQLGCRLQLTWVPGLRLSGQAGSTRTTRFSVGAALRASAVEWKLSSSAPCRPFFSTGPSHSTVGLRLGAMPVVGHRGGPQATTASVPHLSGTAPVCPRGSPTASPTSIPIPSPRPKPALCTPDSALFCNRGQARTLPCLPTWVKEECSLPSLAV